MYRITAVVGLILFSLACSPEIPDAHDHGDGTGGHDHGAEATFSYTDWTDEFEIFVEFSPLIVGEVSTFAAHFTQLMEHNPVTAGRLTVSLVVGRRGVRQTAEEPARPGIFTPSLRPVAAGAGSLQFELLTGSDTVRFTLRDVPVFATAAEAAGKALADEAAADVIAFTKEQAWKTGLDVQTVRRRSMPRVVHTTGELMPMQGDELVVSSPSAGIVRFVENGLLPGRSVRKGELLFTLEATGDPDENLQARLQAAQSTLNQAETEFQRSEQMVQEGLLSQRDFEAARLDLELARTDLENLQSYVPTGGRKIFAPLSGFLKDVDVEPGDFVETGVSVLTITESRKLMLRADVPQRHFPNIGTFSDARFRMLYDTAVWPLSRFRGRRITRARRSSPESPFLPIYFELDNSEELLPGTFAEIFLLGAERDEVIAIPDSALLEEFGTYSVMVQLAGEEFEKRIVRTGRTNGEFVEITEGLRAGERVVTSGAYQVKMASLASSLPAHGHTH